MQQIINLELWSVTNVSLMSNCRRKCGTILHSPVWYSQQSNLVMKTRDEEELHSWYKTHDQFK